MRRRSSRLYELGGRAILVKTGRPSIRPDWTTSLGRRADVFAAVLGIAVVDAGYAGGNPAEDQLPKA